VIGELYVDDVYEWSQHQAALLRRRAAGELINEAELDWPNIAEEIESVGKSELRACRSALVNAIAHFMKARAWPATRYVSRWLHDAETFRRDACKDCTRAMRQNLDVEEIYQRALRELPDEVDGEPPLPVPETCPVTLDELLSEEAASAETEAKHE
jgi:hypothetical protein